MKNAVLQYRDTSPSEIHWIFKVQLASKLEVFMHIWSVTDVIRECYVHGRLENVQLVLINWIMSIFLFWLSIAPVD